MNVTLPHFVFENCTGVGFGIEIPADLTTDDVPSAFGPAGSVPFLANLGVTGIECPRVVFGNQTLMNVAMLWSHLNAIPTNASWRVADSISVFGYDVLVSNETLAQDLQNIGIPAVAATLAKESTAVPGTASQERWTFHSPAVEYTLTFHWDTSSQNTNLQENVFFWFGDNPFLRVGVHQRTDFYSVFAPDGGLVQVAGESGFAKALMTPIAPASGSAIYATTWEIDPESQWFAA